MKPSESPKFKNVARLALIAALAGTPGCGMFGGQQEAAAPQESSRSVSGVSDEEYVEARINECLANGKTRFWEDSKKEWQERPTTEDECVIQVHDKMKEEAEDRERERERERGMRAEQLRREREETPEKIYFNALVDKCHDEERYGPNHRREGYHVSVRDCRIRVFERLQEQCQTGGKTPGGELCSKVDGKSDPAELVAED